MQAKRHEEKERVNIIFYYSALSMKYTHKVFLRRGKIVSPRREVIISAKGSICLRDENNNFVYKRANAKYKLFLTQRC